MTWRDFSPASTGRVRENTEWSITYTFNALDTQKPRVLLIGDSICNGYKDNVIGHLNGKVNVTYWASSKCVTDRDYFRELDFILNGYHYDVISFNNGLHSLVTDRAEWDAAYEKAVEFIIAKLPDARLSLTLSTPLTDERLTAISDSLNKTVLKIAGEKNLPVIDLFSAMDPLDRNEYWTDTYHFGEKARDMQGKIIADHVLERLGL